MSTIPLNSIERIEIIRGNSGAVLYGDNAVGGVINIVTKTGVGGPPAAIRGREPVRLVQPAHGHRSLTAMNSGRLVGVVLRQWHQVRRLPRQQRARPAERRRQPQLHHARPQGLPHRDRRRPEARLPRRPLVDPSIGVNELATNRRGTSTPFDYGNQQGVSATAGFTKTMHERRRPDRRRRRAPEEDAKRILRPDAIHQFLLDL